MNARRSAAHARREAQRAIRLQRLAEHLLDAAASLPEVHRAWLTPRDVGMLLGGKSRETICDWAKTQGLPSTVRAHGRRWIKREDLEAWLQANPWARSKHDQRVAKCTAELVEALGLGRSRGPELRALGRSALAAEGSLVALSPAGRAGANRAGSSPDLGPLAAPEPAQEPKP